MGKGHQGLWQQVATAKQPKGVASVGTDGAPLLATEPRWGMDAREASHSKTKQPSISNGSPHLLAGWDLKANETHGWHPDKITLGSKKKVHWRRLNGCKLGLVHR